MIIYVQFRNSARGQPTAIEIQHFSRHTKSKVLERYVKWTAVGISEAQLKRRIHREEQKSRPAQIPSGLPPIPPTKPR